MGRVIEFSAKTLVDSTQLRDIVCMPSSCGLTDAGTLSPRSIGPPESIAAVRFVVSIAFVDLSRCFCFAKTFVDCCSGADDAILGQLPLPPGNAVQATERPIKSDVGNPGGGNGIANGRDSLASTAELAGSPGTVIQIHWREKRDIRSRVQIVALNSTLPNDLTVKEA